MREVVVVAALVWLVSSPARAQELPSALSFAEVVSLARASSPAVTVAEARARVAHAAIRGAGAYANPTLSWEGFFTFDGSNDAWNGHQNTFGIELPLALSDPMSARARAAELEADAADARTGIVRSDLARLAALAYLDVLADDAVVTAYDRSAAELAAIDALVRARAALGDRSRYDALRVELEVARILGARSEAEASARSSERALGALLGAPGWAPRAAGALEDTLIEDGTVTWAAVVRRLASHDAAERAIEARRADLERERREAWPVPSLGLGYGLTTDAYASAAFVGLSMPLPFFDQNTRGIAVAEAELAASEDERDAIDRVAEARLWRAEADVRRLRAELEAYDVDVVARSAPLREMTTAAYRSGAGTLLELVDAARTLREVELDRIGRLARLRAAEVELLDAAALLVP